MTGPHGPLAGARATAGTERFVFSFSAGGGDKGQTTQSTPTDAHHGHTVRVHTWLCADHHLGVAPLDDGVGLVAHTRDLTA
eukprot:4398279-Lingulodinium_polyedra.AAC.1